MEMPRPFPSVTCTKALQMMFMVGGGQLTDCSGATRAYVSKVAPVQLCQVASCVCSRPTFVGSPSRYEKIHTRFVNAFSLFLFRAYVVLPAPFKFRDDLDPRSHFAVRDRWILYGDARDCMLSSCFSVCVGVAHKISWTTSANHTLVLFELRYMPGVVPLQGARWIGFWLSPCRSRQVTFWLQTFVPLQYGNRRVIRCDNLLLLS